MHMHVHVYQRQERAIAYFRRMLNIGFIQLVLQENTFRILGNSMIKQQHAKHDDEDASAYE